MEKKLKGVKLGMNTLKINVARFAKENELVDFGGLKSDPARPKKTEGNTANRMVNGGHVRPGFSYSMALNTEAGLKPFAGEVDEVRIDAGVVAMGSKHNRAVIARVCNFKILISVKQLLSEAGLGNVVIQYVSVWEEWFSKMDVWIGQALAFERVAWLRVHGIPLHLFRDEVVTSLCSRFGSVVKPPQIGEADGDLSMVSVGVLVGEGNRISEELVVAWQDKRYRVWVSEDLGDWIPDCLDPDGDTVLSEDGDLLFGSDAKSSEMKLDEPLNRKLDEPMHRDFESSESVKSGDNERLHGEDQAAHVLRHAEGFNAGNIPKQVDSNDGLGQFLDVDVVGACPQKGDEAPKSQLPFFMDQDKVGNSGTSKMGFCVGRVYSDKRRGNMRPFGLAQVRKGISESTSPFDNRSKKRSMNEDISSFDYPFPPQNLGVIQGDPGNRMGDSMNPPVDLNLNERASLGSVSETMVGDSRDKESAEVHSNGFVGGSQAMDYTRKLKLLLESTLRWGLTFETLLKLSNRSSVSQVTMEFLNEFYVFQYRGLMGGEKPGWVRGMVSNFGIKFLALQETKKESVDFIDVSGF
ncbi:hypothetical protein Hdeb2414_s0011g00375181 [Helianthus debilis subsp. tardiflorus]